MTSTHFLSPSVQANLPALRNVSLVDCRDTGYIEWARRMKKFAHNPRPRDSYVADYQKMLGALEECVRQFLAHQVCLTSDRILRSCSVSPGGSHCLGFRELDAVAIAEGSPACAIEVKFRENGPKALKGFGQLEQSLRILNGRWPAVNGLLLSFWMAPLFDSAPAAPEHLATFADVFAFLAQPPASATARLCLDVRDLLDVAIAHGLWSHDKTNQLRALRRAALAPLSTVTLPAAPAGGLNSLNLCFAGLALLPAAA